MSDLNPANISRIYLKIFFKIGDGNDEEEDEDEETDFTRTKNLKNTKRCVSFAKANRLVSAASVATSQYENTVDSLEVSRKSSSSSGNNDEKDCQSVLLSKCCFQNKINIES